MPVKELRPGVVSGRDKPKKEHQERIFPIRENTLRTQVKNDLDEAQEIKRCIRR